MFYNKICNLALFFKKRENMGRINFLDNAKILTVILVIFGHLYGTFSVERLYMYAFHMPLFFMISGMLHKHVGDGIQIKKYLKKILLPIIVFFAAFSVFFIPIVLSGALTCDIYSDNGGAITFVKDYLIYNIKSFVLGRDCSNVVLWFLFALFYCKVFLDAYESLSGNRYKKTVFWFVITLVLIKIPSYLYVGQGVMAFPFYILGYKLKPYLSKFENKKLSLSIIPLFIISFIITNLNGRVSMSGLSYGSLKIFVSFPLFYINALIGSFAVIFLSSVLPKLNIDNIANSLISVLGLQMIFVLLYRSFLGDDSNVFIACISSVLIFIICHFLHKYVFSKILNSI